MSYRWFNVKVDAKEDGGASVKFEGRVEFPHGERVEIEEGEELVVHGELDISDSLADQPNSVKWHMKNLVDNEVVASGGDQ